MAFRFSTGLRNRILGKVPTLTATDLAQVDDETITGVAAAFITTGFLPGMLVLHTGFTGGGLNGISLLTKVEAGTLTFSSTYSTFVNDGAGESVVLTAYGQSYRELFDYSALHVYSGSAPATADAAETGTLLFKATKDAGAHTAGTTTNGIRFEAAADVASGVLSLLSSETYQGVGLANGTAGYFRLYDNLLITGSSTTSVRVQGSVGNSGADCILSSTSIVTGATTTIDSIDITQPAV